MLSPATWLREDKGFRSVDSERLNLKASSRYPATSPASARMVSAPLLVRWNQGRFVKWRSVPSRARKKGFKGFILNIEKTKWTQTLQSFEKSKILKKTKEKQERDKNITPHGALTLGKPPQFFLPNLLASHAHAPPHPHVRSPLFVAAGGHNLGAKKKYVKEKYKICVYIICSHTWKIYILYVYI